MEKQFDRRYEERCVLDSAPQQGETTVELSAAVGYGGEYGKPKHKRKRWFLVAPDRFWVRRHRLAEKAWVRTATKA